MPGDLAKASIVHIASSDPMTSKVTCLPTRSLSKASIVHLAPSDSMTSKEIRRQYCGGGVLCETMTQAMDVDIYDRKRPESIIRCVFE